MGWATNHIARLKHGETVQFRPRGGSMAGRIESGQLVTVEPIIDHAALKPDDIVLCSVRGNQFLHLIKARRGERQFLIGNNRGGINGWTTADHIFGRVTMVGP